MTEYDAASESTQPKVRWQALSSLERRIVGVLAEKAKTTPDAYPLSLNAVCVGSNQKTNRSPIMQIEPADAEEALDRLREMGAVGLIEGSGRVAKYRHYLYEWLGVDKIELAVMTELLLRGDQTIGELRGRASRMEPIADLAALRSILQALAAKSLVLFLTPEGRGQVVTHALYKPREIEALHAKYAGYSASDLQTETDEEGDLPTATPVPRAAATPQNDDALKSEIEELRAQLRQLRDDFEVLSDSHSLLERQFRELTGT